MHRGPAFKQDHHLDRGDNGRRILLHNLCPYPPSARNLAPILRSDASDLLAITISESQVTEIDFSSSSVERCMPQVLGARTNGSPR